MKAENYTSVCLYCGIIYKANRSTSLFCNSKHRSLFHKYGQRINPIVLDKFGAWTDADEKLSAINYNTEQIQEEGWSFCYNLESIEEKYGYYGPLPKGDEIIIVGSFAMTRMIELFDSTCPYYGVKHISKITTHEKACILLVKAAF